MAIEWYRDLTIIIYGVMWAIFGLLGIILTMIIGIMAFVVFKRVRIILDSLKVTTANIQEISTAAKEQIVRPINQVGSVFQGITSWIEMISRFFRKSKSEDNLKPDAHP
jgi:hypothetical protein